MIKVEEEILTIYGFKITASKHTTEIELKQDLRILKDIESILKKMCNNMIVKVEVKHENS